MKSKSAGTWKFRMLNLLVSALWLSWMAASATTGHGSTTINVLLYAAVGGLVVSMVLAQPENMSAVAGDRFLARVRTFVEVPATVVFVIIVPSYWWLLLLVLGGLGLQKLMGRFVSWAELQKAAMSSQEAASGDAHPTLRPIDPLDIVVYLTVAAVTARFVVRRLWV